MEPHANSHLQQRVARNELIGFHHPTVVMHVEATGDDAKAGRNRLTGRYWRGVAMSRYAGGRWMQSADPVKERWPPEKSARFPDGEEVVVAHVYREAVEHPYILRPAGLLEIRALPQDIGETVNGSLKFLDLPQRRLRLTMVLGDPVPPGGLRAPVPAETMLPASPWLNAWASEVVDGEDDPSLQIARIEAELKSWTYDLNARIDPERPIEHFISQTRRGHCEMFASALALAARSLGIPARVVNGYFGGEWNEAGGFLIIRQQHAHAWTEVWLDERWRRFDPTPASRWALSGVRFPAWDKVWETVRLAWYRHVLEFQNEDRSRLWRKIKAVVLAYLPLIMSALVAAACVWILLRRVIRRRRRRVPQWPVLDNWLARHGLSRRPCQPLRLLAIPDGVPAARWHGFVEEWERQAYGAAGGWSRFELRRQLRALSR